MDDNVSEDLRYRQFLRIGSWRLGLLKDFGSTEIGFEAFTSYSCMKDLAVFPPPLYNQQCVCLSGPDDAGSSFFQVGHWLVHLS